jgi:hypothetical protein
MERRAECDKQPHQALTEDWARQWSSEVVALTAEHQLAPHILPRMYLVRDWISEAQHDSLLGDDSPCSRSAT